MGTTKLEIYQRAILHNRMTPVTTLLEDNEARRLCDVHYAPTLQHMLESGFWRHAIRTVEITQNTSVTPAFGYEYAHDEPSDFVRRYVVSASDTLEPPLDYLTSNNPYLMEGGYIWANVSPIYLRYVSNDSNYGLDLTKWPEVLTEAASLELAYRICPKLTGSAELQKELDERRVAALGKANQLESLQQPTQTARPGRWVSSRFRDGYSGDDYRRA